MTLSGSTYDCLGPSTVTPAGAFFGAGRSGVGRGDSKDGNKGGGRSGPPEIDPIIRGLLVRLPKSGEVWPEAERELWLQLLEGSLRLIHKDQE